MLSGHAVPSCLVSFILCVCENILHESARSTRRGQTVRSSCQTHAFAMHNHIPGLLERGMQFILRQAEKGKKCMKK